MTKSEAEARCRELAATSPDAKTHRWMPRQTADGTWSVVKVGLPPSGKDLIAEQRADEKPPTPGDTRPPVNPYWGPG